MSLLHLTLVSAFLGFIRERKRGKERRKGKRDGISKKRRKKWGIKSLDLKAGKGGKKRDFSKFSKETKILKMEAIIIYKTKHALLSLHL